MKLKRNLENDRLTVRLDEKTKKEMAQFAEEKGVSLAWIVRRAWIEFKDAVAKGKIRL